MTGGCSRPSNWSHGLIGKVCSLICADGRPGNATLMTGTLGGADITGNAPWEGKWVPVGRVQTGKIKVTVQSTTAQVVRIRAMRKQVRR